ncbi:unnamed protein product [Zymoseptoria tritici ST99CH_1E4]|uniref:AAA+ ATPase domain-containing protein n=1 Tax=Zymoseptoria tritici ST99CH_1E4 TaxID=1276532 RepID=A0A2H1GP21_ZYMTR|nr:unnamed protein product [Zymoseptoria tritici ST99CH_1E4]
MNSNNADADDDDDDVLTTESDRRAAPDGTAGEKGSPSTPVPAGLPDTTGAEDYKSATKAALEDSELQRAPMVWGVYVEGFPEIDKPPLAEYHRQTSPFNFSFGSTNSDLFNKNHRSQPALILDKRALDPEWKSGESSIQKQLDKEEKIDVSGLYDNHTGFELSVSSYVTEVLHSLIEYYPPIYHFPGSPTRGSILDGPIKEPFRVLMHYYNEIEDFLIAPRGGSDSPGASSGKKFSETHYAHTTILRDFLRARFESSVLPIIRGLTQPEPCIEFNDLCLNCWNLVSNGSRVARAMTTQKLSRYAGPKPVKSLPVCPVAIWDAHDDKLKRGQILARSRLYADALKKGSMHARCKGPDLFDGQPYQGHIVLDHLRAWSTAAEELGEPPLARILDESLPKFLPYDHIYLRDDEAVQPTQVHRPTTDRFGNARADPGFDLLLLYATAPAFALSTKQWMMINMDHVRRLKPSEESLQNLALVDEEALELLRGLSARQNAGARSWSADFIEGKGAGQIVLLHGPPGVGKTYTVESIAAWLERPLLSLTVADIGTVETSVEFELVKWFRLAEAWNAILLVDEADIFLEQRKNRDLARNGLVSAFLRRMEYFRGMLFLTTNRVGQIDDAFMSRIHVAIGYESLTPEIRRKVWTSFFDKLERERADKIVIGENAKKYVLEDKSVQNINLNGREIRNALQTAITMAEHECLAKKKPSGSGLVFVEEGHFRRVLRLSEKFHTYITKIRMEDEKKRALGRGDRNDYDTENAGTSI